jgi:hypothetical protein
MAEASGVVELEDKEVLLRVSKAANTVGKTRSEPITW